MKNSIGEISRMLIQKNMPFLLFMFIQQRVEQAKAKLRAVSNIVNNQDEQGRLRTRRHARTPAAFDRTLSSSGNNSDKFLLIWAFNRVFIGQYLGRKYSFLKYLFLQIKRLLHLALLGPQERQNGSLQFLLNPTLIYLRCILMRMELATNRR